jgi:branched-chain amino acid aminotransferase
VSNFVWSRGSLISYKEAGLDPSGWPTGSGIFETVKTVNGLPWALSRHMRRGLGSAKRCAISFPAEKEIRDAVASTIEANPFSVGRLRLLFTSTGEFLVTHQAYEEFTQPAKLTIFERRSDSSGLVEKKFPYDANLSLLDSARAKGFDDGVLINDRGKVTETAIANLLFLIDENWITPPISDGLLPGVMRALAIEKEGVRVASIKEEELGQVSAAFLISSLKIAQPIGQIGERKLDISPESEQMRARIAATALATSVG